MSVSFAGGVLDRVQRPVLVRQGVDRRIVSKPIGTVPLLVRGSHPGRVGLRSLAHVHAGQRGFRGVRRLLRPVLGSFRH